MRQEWHSTHYDTFLLTHRMGILLQAIGLALVVIGVCARRAPKSIDYESPPEMSEKSKEASCSDGQIPYNVSQASTS